MAQWDQPRNDDPHFAIRGDLQVSLEELVERAGAAQREGSTEQAIIRWRAVRNRDPLHEVGWASECALLLQQERHDEAERVVAKAREARPDSLMIAASACVIAMMRMDWIEAATRLALLSWNFPPHPYHQSTVPDFRKTIEGGLAAIGRQRLEQIAFEAERAGDTLRSAIIWNYLFSKNPDQVDHARHGLRGLRQTGHLDAAEQLCQSGLAAHPGDIDLLIQSADLAALRKDWKQAALRWEKALQMHPAPRTLAKFAAPAFLEAGDLDQADALLETAMADEPMLGHLLFIHAGVAERRPDHREAAARWRRIAEIHPDDPGIRYHQGAAMLEAGLQRLEQDEWEDRQSIMPQLDGTALENARTALTFLALGSGCELGSAQRQLGAEPLDLLRFCNVGAADLADLLDQNLRIFNDPDAMTLTTLESGEYFVGLKDGRVNGHGFAYKDRIAPEKFFKRHTARMRLLAQKLLRDLAKGDRILLHNCPGFRIKDEKILRLHEALGRHGRTSLLVTRAAEDGHPEGSIALLAPHVYVGYFWTGYGAERVEPSVSKWLQFLTKSRSVILGPAASAQG